MKRKFLLFAGTSEGRLLSEYLKTSGAEFKVFVATSHGADVLEDIDKNIVQIGKLDKNEMIDIFNNEKISHEIIVIDSSHPYAEVLHDNLREACKVANVEYLRVTRDEGNSHGVLEFPDHKSVANYLKNTNGNILLTTGSKNLAEYTTIDDYKKRVYIRILPEAENIKNANDLGYICENIIAMQGPFSVEMNVATIKEINASYIVTKESGAVGGFPEKLKAAEICGAHVIVIVRPKEKCDNSEIYSLKAAKELLKDRFGLKEATDKTISPLPIFIPIKGKKVLVIGAGNVAQRRINTLLSFGADIAVVAPKVNDGILDLYKNLKISLFLGKFSDSYINETYSLVIAATDDKNVNKRAALIANKLGILVSTSDSCPNSSFYFPAVFKDDDIIVAVISKDLKKHSLVKRKSEDIRNLLRGNK